MKRLRQEAPTNAAFVGAAIRLARATPATQATPEAKRRVWAALEASRKRYPLIAKLVSAGEAEGV